MMIMSPRLVVPTLVLLTVVALSPTLSFAADADAGKAVYLKRCKTCHGAEGQGNPGMAKVLKVEIKHLGSEHVQAKTDDDLTKAILEGFGKMKPVKRLSDEDVDNIIAFVRTIKE